MPDPVVIEIEAPQMDTGAPLPMIAATDVELSLTYFDRDGKRVLINFADALAHYFGPPSDETLDGHPMAPFGLKHYGVFEVHNSRWIEELCNMNRVHPHHSDGQFSRLRHFIWTFHDETFECVAHSFTVDERPD